MAATDTPALRISAVAEGDTTVVTLAGELDLASADLLRERIRALLARGSDVRQLVVDLSGLTFLDVTGVGVLLEAHRKMTTLGGSVLLRHPKPMVVRMLSLLELDEALHIEH